MSKGKKDKNELISAKKIVKEIFKQYVENEKIIEHTKQSLTSKYMEISVQGGYKDGKSMERESDKKLIAEMYNASVEEILSQIPSTYRKIMINRYIRKMYHDQIIAKLGIDDDQFIAESTYYDWYEKAVLKFYNEAIAMMIEKKLKKSE